MGFERRDVIGDGAYDNELDRCELFVVTESQKLTMNSRSYMKQVHRMNRSENNWNNMQIFLLFHKPHFYVGFRNFSNAIVIYNFGTEMEWTFFLFNF